MRTLSALAAAFAFSTAVPAIAADAAVDEVIVIDTLYDWSGVYVGVQGGYGWGDYKNTIYVSGNNSTDIDVDGGYGGLHAAARWQLGQLTLGAEAEINYSDINGVGFLGGSTNSGATLDGDIKWFGSVVGEVGLPLERVLLYVSGGAAFADVDYTTDLLSRPGNTVDSDTPLGWTIGVGADYAMTDHFVIGARYRYYEFDDVFFPDTPAEGGLMLQERTHDIDMHTISLKAAYKF